MRKRRLGALAGRRGLMAFATVLAIIGGTLFGILPASAAATASSGALDSATAATSLVTASAKSLVKSDLTVGQLSAANFNRGYIISDYEFYSTNAMTQAQIQSFLDAHCPSHTCIDNIKTTTNSRAASNMCPTPYVGAANETTAAIIYKVQVSCGISARVILVTLQKEEGLVTKANPSAGALQIAMGYGCPDTAPCSSLYYGLFNQIYDASSQFKRYGLRTSDNVSFRTKFQIGVPYPIQLSPNAACGTVKVTVQNMATTALYYYTPYTPDSAALGNLGGTGDSCSSYGNRNFWVYFSEWFGSPTVGRAQDVVDSEYAGDGGPTGPLGALTSTVPCAATATTCAQQYVGGGIYWSATYGSATLYGAANTAYLASGGMSVLGPITSGKLTSTAAGGGTFQNFFYGAIETGPPGSFIVTGTVYKAYMAKSGPAGPLGWPTSALTTATGYYHQSYQNGSMYYSAAKGAHEVDAPFDAVYQTFGGPTGTLGWPTSLTIPMTANGGGSGQAFATGSIYSSTAGTFATYGAVRTTYFGQDGSTGPLGWPTANPVCTATGCTQTFQGASIYAAKGKAGFAVITALNTAYLSVGGPTGVLGWPTSGVINIPQNGGGKGQVFKGGSIYSSTAGAFAVTGVIRTKYGKVGGSAGALGWPTAAAVCTTATKCSQTFQHGTLTSP